jgi:hypothetical protein
LNSRILALALACVPAFIPAAQARQNPEPPPSGIVIHLFGQDSIMSNILPTAPAVQPAVPAATSSVSPAPASALAPSTGDQEPSLHDILHQMFVTGDPNAPPGFSRGKTGNEP